MASLVEKYLAAVVSAADMMDYRNSPAPGPFMEYADDKDKALLAIFEEHVQKYKEIPSAALLKAEFGMMLPEGDGKPSYWVDRLEKQHLKRGLLTMANGIGENLNKVSESELLEAAREAIQSLDRSRSTMRMLDFRKSLAAIEKKWAEQNTMAMPLGWPTLDEMSGGARPGDLISMVARPGMGKEQPVDTPTLTPTGWRPMGDLQPGDYVIGKDGKPTKVMAVYPQGLKQAYQVNFRDGSSVECGAEHLWQVYPSSGRGQDRFTPRTYTLTTLLAKGLSTPKGGRRKAKWRVPLVDPVQFDSKSYLIDPYVLGVLIGDGALGGSDLRFSCSDRDADIASRVIARLNDVTVHENRSGACPYFSIRGAGKAAYVDELSKLGLRVKSLHKAIPESYLQGSVDQRLDLLRGLMDTDGSCVKNRTAFHTISPRLAEDVASLVRSLGGVAIVRVYDRTSEGKPLEFQVNVKLGVCPFLTPFKASRWRPQTPSRYIWSVEPTRVVEQVCIQVDAGDHLYVTENYVVTHNTYLMAHSNLNVWQTVQEPTLFVSNEMLPEMIAERMAALATHTPAHLLKTNQWPSFSADGIFQGKQTGNKMKQAFIDKMHLIEANGVPLWIVDANMTARVDDVVALADKLGAKMVYVDGAYLMRDDRERNQFARVSLVCTDLKQKLATGLGIPVFASWQFNREAAKLKDGEKAGLEHVAHSDAIPQLSSLLMGMFESETVETVIMREVQILKGRSGETGSFKTHWDFIEMNLGEILLKEEEVMAKAPYEVA